MKVRINQKALSRLKRGHPWIFRSDLEAIEAEKSGVVEILSPTGKVLGQGLYSCQSQIALRIMALGREKINAALIRARLQRARAWRQSYLGGEEAFRWVYGESDGLPSLIIDQFGQSLVFQSLSAGMESLKEMVVEEIRHLAQPDLIVERNDVVVREKEGLARLARVYWGEGTTEPKIKIVGKYFLIPTLTGQKTGFFLDQRFNASRIAPMLKGRLLDAFSYSGQIAVHAASHAESILCVDQSKEALEQLKKNVLANQLTNVETLHRNVFDFLKEQDLAGEKWDSISLDPPAFVKSRSEKSGALRGYKEINLRALKLLNPGGVLATFSCSQNMSREDFLKVLSQAARDARRTVQVLMELTQPFDHPGLLAMPESFYLKGFLLRVF